MSNQWLIFDFDGVIADSEVLANCVLAEIVTALSVATTLEDSYRLFMGKRFPDVIAAIQTAVGARIAGDLPGRLPVTNAGSFPLRVASGARRTGLYRCLCPSSALHRILVVP